MTILDLPEDILSIVFLFLDPKSFLALCGASRVLHDNYHKDPTFWRTKVSSTFRTPISPLLRTDGRRWHSLFQRLKTETRLYTWGQGAKGNLGHGLGVRHRPANPLLRRRPGGIVAPQPPRIVFQRTSSNWPTEAHVPNDIGVIADLQCGGWSTIILSSSGRLYATGSINSANYVNVGSQTDRFERLEYLTQSTSAIAQFSAGRCHILAITDDGDILTWDRINARGLKIHSRHGGKLPGKPTRVVAGWGESSAYLPDVGIVYWQPLKNDQDDEMLDAREVKERIIPNTAQVQQDDGTVYGIIAHIVLEGVLLWVASDSKLWACDIGHYNQEDTEPKSPAVQIPGFCSTEDCLRDVQGSFRNFVVFTASGKVLTGNIDYVRRCFGAAQIVASEGVDDGVDAVSPSAWRDLNDILSTRPHDIPALQNTGVISVKFGDWHYQALHSDGTITSHGHEPESCGALGLGDAYHGGKLRGMITGPQGMRQDTKLRPVADVRGRQIWFEPEKREWLEHLQKIATEAIIQHPDQPYWQEILHDEVKQTIFSEWIEQEGRHWEDGPVAAGARFHNHVADIEPQEDEDLKLSNYFAIAIGAAGWHSGALVLVDEVKAEETRQKWMTSTKTEAESNSAEQKDEAASSVQLRMPGHFEEDPTPSEEAGPHAIWVDESFPRLQFPDATESPLPDGEESGRTLGSALRPWRDGMPTLQELGLQVQ